MAISVKTDRRELARFLETVRVEYWRRSAYDEYRDGLRQTNTSRLVVCQMLEVCPPEKRIKILADLLRLDDVDLFRDPADVLSTAATAGEVVFDLICEICWQQLMHDLAIRVEDEVRTILADV